MRGSPFFDGVRQLDVPLGEDVLKVPVFYYDGTATTGVFPARLSALRRLMPDPRFVPARLTPGLGAVAITAFEYRDTDIGAYNELAVSVVLDEVPGTPNLPGRALLRAMRRGQFHAWVQHLPVTTELARAGGVRFYNYPKFVGSIEFSESDGRRDAVLSHDGEHVLTLRAAMLPTKGGRSLQLFSHLYMDGQPQSSEFKLRVLQGGFASRPGLAEISLGDRHPVARELAGLLASRRALHTQYLAQFEGILYGPDRVSLPLLADALPPAQIVLGDVPGVARNA